MSRSHKKISVDKEKLYNELAKRGITASEASREMGFSEYYVASTLSGESAFPERTVKLLEALFGIKPESYTVGKEETVAKEEERKSVFGIDQVVEELKAVNGNAFTTQEVLDDILEVLIDISSELTTIAKAFKEGSAE